MEHDARSDTELMELAKAGWAPAFAVLLYRHGGAVRATVANDDDPTGAVIGTYVAAMRRLKHRPSEEPVQPWLLELASKHVREQAPVGSGDPPELDDDDLDEIWAELDLRWPNGRVSRRPPAWVGWVALVIALIALGVLVPYVVLGADANGDDEETLEQLRALPLDAEEPERDAAPELFEDEALGELPVFEFPEVEEELAPPPESSGPVTPPPPPAPPPAPDPEPETEAPEPETGEPTDDDGDGGDDDGGDDGDGDGDGDDTDDHGSSSGDDVASAAGR